MLYAPLGEGKPTRVQGCFISPEEIEDVVSYVKETGEANYSQEVIAQIEQSVQEKENKGGKGASAAADTESSDEDELLPAAVDVVLETGQASVSMLRISAEASCSTASLRIFIPPVLHTVYWHTADIMSRCQKQTCSLPLAAVQKYFSR